MVTLDVYNARTWFDGPEGQLEVMYECIRVKDKNSFWKAKATIRAMAYRGAFGGMSEDEKQEEIERIEQETKWVKFYDRRTNSFGTGLFKRVCNHLQRMGTRVKILDHRTKIRTSGQGVRKPIFRDKVEVRQEQVDAVRAALTRGKGILHCATNFGKTEVACWICDEYRRQCNKIPRVLFLIHRKQLAVQTMKRFQKHLGDSIPITMIGAGKKGIPNKGILVATTQTASNVLRRVAFRRFMERCNILFIDEFHINKAWQVSRTVNQCAAPMRFGLSGTIDKENKIKWMHYKAMTGPIIAETRNEELVKLGRSAKPIIRMVEVQSQKIKGVKYGEAYRIGVVRNWVRNGLVVDEVLRYVKKNYRTLVTVARISHGRRIQRALEKESDLGVEFLSGTTPLWKREKVIRTFEKGKIAVLIASPIFDVGVDIPDIEAWVNAAGGVGWELVLQRLGRVLRKKEGDNKIRVTDFIDLHNKYLLRHSLKRLEYYEKEKIADIRVVTKKEEVHGTR
jgi:superfamily II DNA or RNA helicase